MRWVAGSALLIAAFCGLALSRSSYEDVSHGGSLLLFALAMFGVFALFSGGYDASSKSRIRWFPANGALRWALAGVVAILALTGLFHAQAAVAGSFAYYNGLALFLTAVAYDFVLLKDWFDRRSDASPDHGAAGE